MEAPEHLATEEAWVLACIPGWRMVGWGGVGVSWVVVGWHLAIRGSLVLAGWHTHHSPPFSPPTPTPPPPQPPQPPPLHTHTYTHSFPRDPSEPHGGAGRGPTRDGAPDRGGRPGVWIGGRVGG